VHLKYQETPEYKAHSGNDEKVVLHLFQLFLQIKLIKKKSTVLIKPFVVRRKLVCS